MSKFSQLVYEDEMSVKRQLTEWGFESHCVKEGSMIAYVASNDDTVVIAFRGTDMYELADWIINLRFDPVLLSHGRVHYGWYAAYKRLEVGIVNLLPKDGNRRRKLWITGHSLGGALAVNCGYSLREKGFQVDSTVTFGQPMVAGRRMAAFLTTQNTDRYIRFVNQQDVVPKLPPFYSHFGKLAWFYEGFVDIRGHRGNATELRTFMSNQQFPPGQAPLNQYQFQRLKQVLAENRNQVDERRGAKRAASVGDVEGFLPMIDDHSMDLYVEKVKSEMLRSRSDERSPAPRKSEH